MNKPSEQVQAIIKSLSVAEKCSLLVGANFWESTAISKKNIRAVTFNDGPFGLRKPAVQTIDAIGRETIPATSFPPTTLLAATFNSELLYEMGVALGKECVDQDVDILLGPGINIKRSPLCGRNFEYFSEDPFLTGTLASALVRGINRSGRSACIKHFAANNQENKRFSTNAIIDERALHEIYLRPFNMVLQAKPKALMCAYNYVNGVKVSEDKTLLKNILRDEYNFNGVVVSDWGAVTNDVKSLQAGVNLKMPGPQNDVQAIYAALKKGTLTHSAIDELIAPLISLSLEKKSTQAKNGELYNDNFILATKIAEDGAVLLKNEKGILPLSISDKIALIGDFAQNPHYQGLGSSAVTPTKETSLYNEFVLHNINFTFAKGYGENEIIPNDVLINEAVAVARTAAKVILCVGLPKPYEVEGTDRVLLDLPQSHVRLIESVCAVNANVVILLTAGAPVVMPWLCGVRGLLHMHLPGSSGGRAAYNLLFGNTCPSGKLAETYPAKPSDTPTANTFWQSKRNVLYFESIYVGYRFYEKTNKDILFPFGFGLSYTTFSLNNFVLTYVGEEVTIKLCVENKGNYDGSEVIQLYVGKESSKTFTPVKELKAFTKVFLKIGEQKEVTLKLKHDDLMFYDTCLERWNLENTKYVFFVGNSSQNTTNVGSLTITCGDDLAHFKDYKTLPPTYFNPTSETIFSSLDKEFNILFDKKLPLVKNETKRPFTNEVALKDTRNYLFNRFLIKKAKRLLKNVDKTYLDPFLLENFLVLPLRSFVELSSRTFNYDAVEGLRLILNGHYVKGRKLLNKSYQFVKCSKSRN